MIFRPSCEQRVQIVHDLIVDSIHSVDNRFELFVHVETGNKISELVTCDAAIVQKEVLEIVIIEHWDCLYETTDLSWG